jgi:SAM-dependent methyltransferase
MHDSTLSSPSPWLVRHAPLIRHAGTVLDLACGAGRNARWLAGQGWQVEAVDRDADALATMRGIANITIRHADLENGPWPYAGCRFDGIVVCRYLHRPLLPLLADSLAEDGMLIYETFMLGQERFGRPGNPDFLLRPDELLQAYATRLHVVAFGQGLVDEGSPAMLQRICARR